MAYLMSYYTANASKISCPGQVIHINVIVLNALYSTTSCITKSTYNNYIS